MICILYRFHDSAIINNRFKASKTLWPIPQIEQVFLPDFKIKSPVNEHSFEVIINVIFQKK